MSVVHELKTWPLYWDAVARGVGTGRVPACATRSLLGRPLVR